jgi:polysaccharide pyruvyl transferase WcaK-like protein
MRFHAGILSCVHEIPYIPLSYGSKTDEFVRALEIEKYAIRPNELSFELFTTIWHNFIADYANEKDRITQKHTIFHD